MAHARSGSQRNERERNRARARALNTGRSVGSLTARRRRTTRLAAAPGFRRLALFLLAVALTQVLARVAAMTTPISFLVALGEDHISSQEAFVAISGDTARSDLVLDGCASSS
jgi:hypothetical protein